MVSEACIRRVRVPANTPKVRPGPQGSGPSPLPTSGANEREMGENQIFTWRVKTVVLVTPPPVPVIVIG